MRRRHSYDIFDTLLTRAVGQPASAFLLLGQRLSHQGLTVCSPAEFVSARVLAERQARQIRPSGEVALAETYRQLAAAMSWNPQQRDDAMRLECQIEEKLIVPVPHAAERLQQIRQRSGGIAFLSDMYLPIDMVKDLLVRHGLWQEGDRLYLSHAADASKASGALFKSMLTSEDLKPGDVNHCGNNRHSDVAAPRTLGLQVSPFFDCDLNRYEAILEAAAAQTGGLSSLLAGASRLTRLSLPGGGERERAIREVAAGVIAPVLASFVLWILQEAQKKGLRRLYFVSRDGQILLRIAQALAPKLGLTIELRYLHGSRQSWHLPSITTVDASKLEWMCIKYDFLSLRSILFRVAVDPDEVRDLLSAAGFEPQTWDDNLDEARTEKIKTMLSAGPLHDHIVHLAAQRRSVALDYFRQEGLLDHDQWGMVDVGWNGRLQGSLGDILGTVGSQVPHGFYFALATRPASRFAGSLHAFLFDPDQQAFRQKCFEGVLATVLEIGCAADHGTVEGYARTGEAVLPILREPENLGAKRWGLSIMQETIVEFARQMMLPRFAADNPLSARDACVALIRTFWDSPTRCEAAAWGSFPFENDQSGTTIYSIAQPYSFRHVINLALGHRKARPVSSWHEGSLAITPPLVRQAMRAGRRCKSILRSVRSGS